MEPTFPVYTVLDVSASTRHLTLTYNQAMGELIDGLASSPRLGEIAYLSVISFADDAAVELPLTRIDHVVQIPDLQSRGGTSYGSAFRLLRERIEIDVADLKAQSKMVYRPLVLFITDGAPTDPWQPDFERLTVDFLFRPTIVAVGVSEVDVHLVLQIASREDLAFVSRPGDSAAVGVRGAFSLVAQSFESLLRSINTSPNTAALTISGRPEGLVQVPPALI
jgi:uncharacterized protein YegL